MAEFQEVYKQWHRLCMSFEDKAAKDYRPCAELCPVGCNPVCGELCESTQEDAERFESAVMAWAAEHPVVYPTWGQYFRRYYGLEYCKGHEMLLENIPADLAEKLGLVPKEGT